MTFTELPAPWAPSSGQAQGLFAANLRRFGDALAVVTDDDITISYRDLADRVDFLVDILGPVRRLVLVHARNDLDSLVAYLAALAGGHVALLSDAHNEYALKVLHATYSPDVTLNGSSVKEHCNGSSVYLHPDLALLLSTSGSTGSPKLVRLSYENLQSNADAIASYVDVQVGDRAATTLPMHYCYGLSIVNSNLSRGGAMLLSDNSVVDECFWRRFKEFGGTSLHGVPLTFDLLNRAGFESMHLPTLRYVTQAGGRLAPDQVQRFADLGRRNGWDFFVMYGQTEATARMAYLPPDLAMSNPTAIGIPIPGGSIELDGGDNADEGELIYRGPNVMLGYAETVRDLSLGRTVEQLATGDLARIKDNGLIEIVGRKSRFVKVAGLRVDLDRLESDFKMENIEVAVFGDDKCIGVLSTSSPRRTQRALRRYAIPIDALRVGYTQRIPRLSNGKVDYQSAQRLLSDGAPVAPTSIRAAYQRALRVPHVSDNDSFVSLGGDSLSYVSVSVEIERICGVVPRKWHTMTIGESEGLSPRRHKARYMETSVALRAVAIALVVGSHVGMFHVLGGALVLLLMAGWSFSRFVLTSTRSVPRSIAASALAIAVPSVTWISYRAMTQDDVGLANVLLVNNYFGSGSWGYWYIETLMQTLAILAVVFAIPKVRNAERRHPFAVPLVALAVATSFRFISNTPDGAWERFIVAHVVGWIFFLGWAAHRAESRNQKLVMTLIAFVLTAGFFGNITREAILIGGVLLLMFVPAVRISRFALPVLTAISNASLYIYLTHYGTYPWLLQWMPAWATTGVSMAIGVVAWWLATKAMERLSYRGAGQQLRW